MKWKLTAVILSALILLSAAAYLLMNPEKNVLNEATRKQLGGTYVKLSRGMTHYKLEGPEQGKVVVLVHGATIPMWTWDDLAADLVSAGYRVLSYDMYGRGYSDRPDVVYDQALLRKQLKDLADTLKLTKPFDLVGLSLGAATAVNFTDRHPERVRKLVLIQPMIKDFKTPSFFAIPILGEFFGRFFGIRVIAKRFASQVADHPKSDQYIRLFVEQTTFKGFERSLLSMLRNDAVQDYSAAYRNVGRQKRDILLIWGSQDPEITKGMIELVRALIPHVTFEPVEGVGHGIVFQQPEAVSRLTREFLLF